MSVIETILKQPSLAIKDKVCRYVGSSPTRFNSLVKAFFKGPYRVTQRASWPLSHCVEHHPALIKPHLKKIITHLRTPGHHDSVKRNTIRLLQFIDIPKSLQGSVVDICFEFLSDPKEPIAVKVFSMTVLANITRERPELGNELIIVIEDQLPYSGPAFISRARRVRKQLRTFTK
jgi:hypothetical protein